MKMGILEDRTLKGLLLQMKLGKTADERILAEELIEQEFHKRDKEIQEFIGGDLEVCCRLEKYMEIKKIAVDSLDRIQWRNVDIQGSQSIAKEALIKIDDLLRQTQDLK